MKLTWCVVGHYKGDPDEWVQQVYGPFPTKKAAQLFIRKFDKSWYTKAFALIDPARPT